MASAQSLIYVLTDHGLLQASVVDIPDIIDFGLPGLHITSTQFVGVRYVGPGLLVGSPRSSTSVVSDILKVIRGYSGSSNELQKKETPSAHTDVKSSVSEFMHQQFDRLSNEQKSWRFNNSVSNVVAEIDEVTRANQESGKLHKRVDLPSSTEANWDGYSPCERKFPDMVYHTWELVWKEDKAGGPLRRVRFVTTVAGYRFIQEKLNMWASAAHTSEAMNKAARAALDACGGSLKENPISESDHVSEYGLNGKSQFGGDSGDHIDQLIMSGDLEKELISVGSAVHLGNHKHLNAGDAMWVAPVHFHETRSQVLEDDHVTALAALLPVRFRSCTWTLLYSTYRDGISLNTLYRKIHSRGSSILVVCDKQKYVFGCFASEEWKVALKYYGTGECFVFQVCPEMKSFKWAHANNWFMFSNLEMLAVGGGDHYSIFLDSELLNGYSGPCDTFGSPGLASAEEFDVVLVEVWGFL